MSLHTSAPLLKKPFWFLPDFSTNDRIFLQNLIAVPKKG